MVRQTSMAEALRLTRAGDLMEATKLIQAALGSGRAVTVRTTEPADKVITLVPRRIPLGGPEQSEPRSPNQAAGRVTVLDSKAGFEKRSYRGSQGSMTYWLYCPADLALNAPLVVMLHGCTQSSEDFARGTGLNDLADELGFLVAYPQQSPAANPQKCWNWFRPDNQRRDHGEPAQLAGITRQVIAEHQADPERVYIAGLSAGGAAAAIMAEQYPDIYAAVGVHSGVACGAARDLLSALTAMRQGGGATPGHRRRQPFVPVITFHGDRDTTVNEANSQQIVAAATSASGRPLKVQTENGRSRSGRNYTRAQSIDSQGTVQIEQWTIEGSGHAWSGGHPTGSYTDPGGPDASRAMVRFFLNKKRAPNTPANS